MPGKGTFRGAVSWSYLMTWGDQILTALASFVLAAILAPHDFGVVAMAWVYVMFIQMLLDQGLVAALIQRKDLREEHLNSAFWMVIAATLALMALGLAFSRWWASVNHVPELAVIIRALSLCIPIEGLTIVQKAVLNRDMDFKSLSLRANLAMIVGGTIGVVMALLGCGVWALVGQRLTQDLAGLAVLWKLSDWRPQWQFSKSAVKDLLGFSTANFAAKLGTFASTQTDALLMGLFFGPVAVGLYRLADRIMGMVFTMAASAVQTVSFPQFSRFQDHPDQLKSSVLSCLRLSCAMNLPVMAGMSVASGLIMSVFGARWHASSDVLRILCVLGMVLPLSQFTGPLLQALSRPRWLALLTWAFGGVSAIALAAIGGLFRNAAVHEQVVAVAFARSFIGIALLTPVFVGILLRLCRISFLEFLNSIAGSIAASAGVAGVVWVVSRNSLLAGIKPALQLATCAVAGLLTAVLLLFLLDRTIRQTAASFPARSGARPAAPSTSENMEVIAVPPVQQLPTRVSS